MPTVVGTVLSAARTRPQPFQGPGPTGGRWLHNAWGLPTMLQWWGNPHPKKNPDSRLLEARAFHGPTGDGLSSQSDLFNGLIQLAAVAPAICAKPATVGAGLGGGSPSALFWLNLGALCGQQKPLLCRPGAVRSKCSEGPGAQGTRKCVVSVRSKGTIACS